MPNPVFYILENGGCAWSSLSYGGKSWGSLIQSSTYWKMVGMPYPVFHMLESRSGVVFKVHKHFRRWLNLHKHTLALKWCYREPRRGDWVSEWNICWGSQTKQQECFCFVFFWLIDLFAFIFNFFCEVPSVKYLAWFIWAEVKYDMEPFCLLSRVSQLLHVISCRRAWKVWSGTVLVCNRRIEGLFKKGNHCPGKGNRWGFLDKLGTGKW